MSKFSCNFTVCVKETYERRVNINYRIILKYNFWVLFKNKSYWDDRLLSKIFDVDQSVESVIFFLQYVYTLILRPVIV